MNGLKKRLDDAKEKWVEELPHLVDPQGRPPSQLLMTVIPLETGFPTLRTSSFTLSNNDRLLEKSLDLIEERRENASVQLAYY